MRFAITSGDAGDHVAVERVALVRPVDGDPERLPALFDVSRCLSVIARPLGLSSADINESKAANCKRDLAVRDNRGAAFFNQTLLSWNAAPPIAATARRRSAC